MTNNTLHGILSEQSFEHKAAVPENRLRSPVNKKKPIFFLPRQFLAQFLSVSGLVCPLPFRHSVYQLRFLLWQLSPLRFPHVFHRQPYGPRFLKTSHLPKKEKCTVDKQSSVQI